MPTSIRKIPFNNLTGTGVTTSAKVAEAVLKVIKSGTYVLGHENKAFENEFAEYQGINYVAGVASGTDALRLALAAVGCRAGDTVITTANAGGYSTIAALSIGCKVEFCDIDPTTHLIDVTKLRQLLHSGISAIVITHLYGNLVDFSSLLSECRALNIAVVEDCAQSLGGIINGKKAGTLGDIATFSFYPTKNLGAAGDGGAIGTNNSDYLEKVISLRQYGWKEKYDVQMPGGMNSRLDEIQAAVLRVQLEKLDQLNQIRQALLGYYQEFFYDTSIELVSTVSQNCAPHLAVIKLPLSVNRDQVKQKLDESGISTSIHYPILDFQQRGFGFNVEYWAEELEISLKSNSRILSLPLYPGLDEDDVRYIASELKGATRGQD